MKSNPGLKNYIRKYLNKDFIYDLLCNPNRINVLSWVLLIFEVFLNIFIVHNVKYTEIDWKAYMQEIEGFLNGTLDYKQLKGWKVVVLHINDLNFAFVGDTGPLVYPAGFVYIYSAFYFITSQGQNIRLAQYIFIGLYILQLYFVFQIYIKTAKIPPYALIISTLTSYRIHSIYVLRLFNDPIAVLFFYISLTLFLSSKWLWGSIFYSLAVSVKMNILLYAPCLLMVYLTNLTVLETLFYLFICGFVQVVLGAPFLCKNFVSYLQGSFDLGRIFEHKWTVNYRFLDRNTFENPYFHISLLILHVILLLLFLLPVKKYLNSYSKLNHIKSSLLKDVDKSKINAAKTIKFDRNAQLMVLPFFVTNLIGIACARSLHYQFYCWYFHSLIYLGFCTKYKQAIIFLILGVIELCWNTYPSTELSSVCLHVCHLFLLIGVYNYMNN